MGPTYKDEDVHHPESVVAEQVGSTEETDVKEVKENTRTEGEANGVITKVEGTDAADRCQVSTDSNLDDTKSRQTGNETEGSEAQIDNGSQRDQTPLLNLLKGGQ